LFVMSDFQLDVDSPYDKPIREVLDEKPQLMEYPKSSIRYGHYGQYTQRILESSKAVTDEKEREFLKTSMANFMKKQFLAHNNDAVENHVIAQQLKELSKGDLILENPDELMNTNFLLRTMGIGNNQNKRKGNFKQNKKKKFKK